MFGVSPAYFISRFTSRFTPEQVANSIPDIASLGFDSVQLEVYHPETLPEFVAQMPSIRDAVRGSELSVSQFVAHFLIERFTSPKMLSESIPAASIKGILDFAKGFDECSLITVPLGAFSLPKGQLCSEAMYGDLYKSFKSRIRELLHPFVDHGYRLALELIPGNFLGSTAGFIRLKENLKADDLGLNWDTGHSWACKEPIVLSPAILGDSLFGTHLCDNFSFENLSLAPGKGSLPWPVLIAELKNIGYAGSFDIEIISPVTEVRKEYRDGLEYISQLVKTV